MNSIEEKIQDLELNFNKKLTKKKINIDKINMSSPKTTTIKSNNSISPLVKWSGGKKDELKQFAEYIPEFDTYLEPFIGGGAVYFHLNPAKAVITDVHKELINLYKAIKNEKSDEIYKFMEAHPNEEKVYYEVRDKMPIADYLDSAKRFFYQRKTCFRGMLRYNSSGKFNIPFGRYKTYNFEILKNKSFLKLPFWTSIRILGAAIEISRAV